ncbi:hypothetical protein BGW80DRAFT_197695 [Lactifluus volemus]|nr:hypothetical protein BGW80DRAFT_197695 [Lactifluus volemus]
MSPNLVSRSAACRHLFFFVGTSICTPTINAASWFLVRSMVCVGIELGLITILRRNSPTSPSCQFRIRLWGIVHGHDPSLLRRHPLSILPNDTNMPQPSERNHSLLANHGFSMRWGHSRACRELRPSHRRWVLGLFRCAQSLKLQACGGEETERCIRSVETIEYWNCWWNQTD